MRPWSGFTKGLTTTTTTKSCAMMTSSRPRRTLRNADNIFRRIYILTTTNILTFVTMLLLGCCFASWNWFALVMFVPPSSSRESLAGIMPQRSTVVDVNHPREVDDHNNDNVVPVNNESQQQVRRLHRRSLTAQEWIQNVQRAEMQRRRHIQQSRIGGGDDAEYPYEHDAFGTARRYDQQLKETRTITGIQAFFSRAAIIRERIMERYGVELQVRNMLQKGMIGTDVALRRRLRNKLQRQSLESNTTALSSSSFQILVVGTQSLWVGNQLPKQQQQQQSAEDDFLSFLYPQQLARLLEPVFDAVNVSLNVQTVLLRDHVLPDFPWMWWCCFSTHPTLLWPPPPAHGAVVNLPDVVIWDVAAPTTTDAKAFSHFSSSSSSASSLKRLEILLETVILPFMRQLVHMQQPPPHVILRGISTMEEWEIVRRYQSQLFVPEPDDTNDDNHHSTSNNNNNHRVTLILELDAIKPFWQVAKQQRPPGFDAWPRRHVAGKPAPSLSLPPAAAVNNGENDDWISPAQHELIASLLTLYVLGALERVVLNDNDNDDNDNDDDDANRSSSSNGKTNGQLPTRNLSVGNQIDSMNKYHHPWHCYSTTPVCHIQTHSKNTNMLVQHRPHNLKDMWLDEAMVNTTTTATTAIRNGPRWVFQTYPRLLRIKKDVVSNDDILAFWGVPTSGTLRLAIPFGINLSESVTTATTAANDARETKSHRLVVCSLPLLSSSSSSLRRSICSLEQDVSFRINGITLESIPGPFPASLSSSPTTSCIHLNLPPELLRAADQFLLEIQVSKYNNSSTQRQPCSISHVMWNNG